MRARTTKNAVGRGWKMCRLSRVFQNEWIVVVSGFVRGVVEYKEHPGRL